MSAGDETSLEEAMRALPAEPESAGGWRAKELGASPATSPLANELISEWPLGPLLRDRCGVDPVRDVNWVVVGSYTYGYAAVIQGELERAALEDCLVRSGRVEITQQPLTYVLKDRTRGDPLHRLRVRWLGTRTLAVTTETIDDAPLISKQLADHLLALAEHRSLWLYKGPDSVARDIATLPGLSSKTLVATAGADLALVYREHYGTENAAIAAHDVIAQALARSEIPVLLRLDPDANARFLRLLPKLVLAPRSSATVEITARFGADDTSSAHIAIVKTYEAIGRAVTAATGR